MDIRDAKIYLDKDGKPYTPPLKKEYLKTKMVWRYKYVESIDGKTRKQNERTECEVWNDIDTFHVRNLMACLKRGGIVLGSKADTSGPSFDTVDLSNCSKVTDKDKEV